MNLHFRQAQPHDFDRLLHFARENFKQTYAHRNSPEDMALYLSQNYSPAAFRVEFSHSDSVFYLAEMNDELVGYLKMNHGEVVEKGGCEIERIYVASEQKGRGIGRQLLQWAKETARRAGAQFVWLGVWEHNQPAIDFYQRLGFSQAGTSLFQLGNDLQTDLVMRYELVQGD